MSADLQPAVDRATGDLDARMFDGLSIYQDVVLAGRTVLSGRRDGHERLEKLWPHLPERGVVLDIGSNFGWFGLQITADRPDVLVASVEADERSAAVQRAVLASHDHRQIALLTDRAGPRMMRVFAEHAQRFDTALLLSVLHWIPRHRQMLIELGTICADLLIEHPDPREEGAGSNRIRKQIGPIAPYLSELFPYRPVVQLGTTTSHRTRRYPRQLWWVGRPPAWQAESPSQKQARPALSLEALLELQPAWPSREWLQTHIQQQSVDPSVDGQWIWTGEAAEFCAARAGEFLPWQRALPQQQLLKRVAQMPHDATLSPWRKKTRQWRRMATDLRSRLEDLWSRVLDRV